MNLLLIFLAVILFIVIATTKFGLHPFLTLLCASFITAFVFGLPIVEVVQVVNNGFGGFKIGSGLIYRCPGYNIGDGCRFIAGIGVG